MEWVEDQASLSGEQLGGGLLSGMGEGSSLIIIGELARWRISSRLDRESSLTIGGSARWRISSGMGGGSSLASEVSSLTNEGSPRGGLALEWVEDQVLLLDDQLGEGFALK